MMNAIYILTVLLIGASGLIAQMLLTRELLVSFNGNELTLGIILASWLMAEALGVFVSGKLFSRSKESTGMILSLQMLFALSFPLAVYAARAFKSWFLIPAGEGLGLSAIFAASLLTLVPVALFHGALFAAACQFLSSKRGEKTASISKAYALETIGTLMGGVLFTYAAIPYLSSFRIAFITSLANIAICFLILARKTRLHYRVSAVVLFCVIWFLCGRAPQIEKASWQKQLRSEHVLDYQNSVYGNIAVIKNLGQHTFLYNGIPLVVTPFPERQFTQDFGHLPLLFHEKNPAQVLLLGGGAGGLLHEMLKYKLSRLTYIEIDPLFISMLKKHAGAPVNQELNDSRVRLLNVDGRRYLREVQELFDVIAVGISDQSEISSNRFFTREFFSIAKNRLVPEGIFALWLPASLTYLSSQLRGLNGSVLEALRKSFAYTRIIPGEYAIFLSSDSPAIMPTSSATLSQRLSSSQIDAELLTPAYLEYRLRMDAAAWFNESLEQSRAKVNSDEKPIAVLEMFSLWNNKFSPKSAFLFEYARKVTLKNVSAALFFLTILFWGLIRRFPGPRIPLTYSIATTGFFGMCMTLVLSLSFQSYYGYLYHRLAMLVSVFMAGSALGSMLMARAAKSLQARLLGLYAAQEICMLIFSLGTGFAILYCKYFFAQWPFIFYALFCVSGILVGAQFALASALYGKTGEKVAATAGALYASDLIGGCFAGLLGGVVLIPVLGVFETCVVMAMCKGSSLVILCTKGIRGSGN